MERSRLGPLSEESSSRPPSTPKWPRRSGRTQGLPFEMTVERIEPQKVFAFRWHPFAVERDVDYSSEPTTLVEFSLEDVADGVMLTVTESGFDGLPLARRAGAFSANEGGWTMVMTLIEKHLAHAA